MLSGTQYRDHYVHVLRSLGPDDAALPGARKKRKVAHKEDDANLPGVDVIALDATDVHRQTQRRYRTETIATLQVAAYWELMEISLHTREPWHHMMCFLQTDPSCDPEQRYGMASTQLSVLVGGKYNEFLQDFENILDNHHLAQSTTAPEATVCETIVTLVLVNHAHFNMRIAQPCSKGPLVVLLLDHECFGPETRARCAGQLLSDTDAICGDCATLLKFKDVFFHDLTLVAADGSAQPPFLQAAVSALRIIASSHTQHVESAHKMVSSETERAPQIMPELISARLCLKKTLHHDGVQPRSGLATTMFDIISKTLEPHYNSKEYHAIANDSSRFAPPPITDFNAFTQVNNDKPTPLCLQDSGSDLVMKPLEDAAPTVGVDIASTDDTLAWAYCWNLVWSRQWEKKLCFASNCLHFTLANGDVQRWLCCMKFYSEGTFHKLEQFESTSQTLLRLRRPFESIQSSEMFAHLRRTWGDTTQNITCDMLTLEWHRTPEYGYASKIVSSQPMFKHNTMKFDIDHAVSVLNGVAGRDGATPTARPRQKEKQRAKQKLR